MAFCHRGQPGKMKKLMKKYKGWEAIERAELDRSVQLNKYNDPTEDAREDITVDEAREIAREDPGLIYAVEREGDEDKTEVLPEEMEKISWSNYTVGDLLRRRQREQRYYSNRFNC